MLTFWEKVALTRPGYEVLAWWKRAFADEYARVEPLLVRCIGVAGNRYPEPRTGYSLTIRETNGKWRAFPTGDRCEDFEDQILTWEDVQAWRVDWAKVEKAMAAEATGVAAAEGATGVKIIGDFQVIRIPGRREIKLGSKHKARAVLRFIREQLQSAGVTDFYVEEMREKFNGRFTGSLAGRQWRSDRFREDLFRGKEADFDLLFESLDKAAGHYRMRV